MPSPATGLTPGRVWWHVATGLVVLLAVYAAFHKLGYRSMWYDELRTLQVYAAHPFDVRNGDPPLYSLYVRGVSRLTTAEFWLRLPNALGLIVIATVVSVAWRRWLHPVACVAAGAACATSVALLTSGQMVRPYGINVACTVLAYTALLRFLETTSWRWAVAYVVSAAAALYTHYSAVLLCGVHAVGSLIWLATHRGARWRTIIRGAAAAALLGIIVAPWYVPLYRNLAALLASTPAPRQAVSLVIFARFVMREFFQGLPFELVLTSVVGGVLLALARRTRIAVLLLLLWLLSGFLFVYHQTTTRGMFLASRYYLFFLPPAYLLAASGIAESISLALRAWPRRVSQSWEAGLICFAWLAFWWPSLGAWRAYQRYHRNTDSRQVAALSRHLQRQGIPVIYNGWHLAFTHYPHALQRGDPHKLLAHTEPVYYLTDQPVEVLSGAPFAAYDAVHIPYEGTPHVFALFRRRTPLTNYVRRATAVLREALSLDPRHLQIKELLRGLECVAGICGPARAHAQRRRLTSELVFDPYAWEGICGWSAVERWPDGHTLRWTVGRVAALRLPPGPGVPRALTLRACGFGPPPEHCQLVTAWLDGHCLGTRQVTSTWQELHWEIGFVPELSEGHTVAFDIERPCPPSAIGRGSDTRALGMAVNELRVALLPPLAAATLRLGSETDSAYLDHAWSHCEIWPGVGNFRWITGTIARVTWLEDQALDWGVWRVRMLPLVTEKGAQRVTVLQDEVVLTNLVLAPEWVTYQILSPASQRRAVQLTFVFAHAWQPRSLGTGDDPRWLAAAVATIRRERHRP